MSDPITPMASPRDDGLRLIAGFELAPAGAGTQLTLTVTLADHHADGSTGYHVCLDALSADLDGTPILHRSHDLALEARYRAAIDAMRAEVAS